MKAGYSAFVKKGTSTTANVFKPSVTSRMTEEPDLFDNLLRETTTKQKEGANDSMETDDNPVEPIIGPVVPMIPLVKPPPPPDDDDEEEPVLQNGTPLTSWDTPASSATIQSIEGTIKDLPADRTSAILAREKGEDLSEGECSDSEDEKMES